MGCWSRLGADPTDRYGTQIRTVEGPGGAGEKGETRVALETDWKDSTWRISGDARVCVAGPLPWAAGGHVRPGGLRVRRRVISQRVHVAVRPKLVHAPHRGDHALHRPLALPAGFHDL
jgi:hypothetical protein